MKRNNNNTKNGNKKALLNYKTFNSIAAYLVSMSVAGVSPYVCETLIDEFCATIKKTTAHWL